MKTDILTDSDAPSDACGANRLPLTDGATAGEAVVDAEVLRYLGEFSEIRKQNKRDILLRYNGLFGNLGLLDMCDVGRVGSGREGRGGKRW